LSQSDLFLKKNTGPLDRAIRAAVGSALILWPAYRHWSIWAVALLAALGGSFVVEAITGY
jgi:hypothetical protein